MLNIFPKSIALLFFCLGFSLVKKVNPLYAQLSDQHFEKLYTGNGLSSNHITDIIQDKDGFYWISTLNGLNRFDGSSIRVFRHNKNDTLSINHNVCNFMVEGDDGDIWVGTIRGVCRYRKKTGVFTRYYFHDARRNDDILNRVNGLTKDEEGNIWAGTYGLWKINPVDNSVQGFLYDAADKTSISDSMETQSLFYDSIKKGLWMVTQYAINFFDPVSTHFYHKNNNPLNWSIFQLPEQKPFLTLDKEQRVWVYDQELKGLHCFQNGNTHFFRSFPLANELAGFSEDGEGNFIFRFDTEPSLFYNWQKMVSDTMPPLPFANNSPLSRIVSRAYLDHKGNKWLTSSEGLYVITKSTDHVHTYLLDKDDAGFLHAIWSVAEQPGKFWLGTKKGLYTFNPTKHTLSRFSHPLLEKDIRTMYNAGDSVLWVSSRKQLMLLDLKNYTIRKKLQLPSYPYFITTDKWGHFWVGTFSRGLFEMDSNGQILNNYDETNGLKFPYLLSCYNENGNVLWVGMNGGKGFARFDITARSFENFLITSDKQVPIEFNSINAITGDSTGNLWLGTYGGGIYYYNRVNKTFRGYRQSDGLSGDFVNTLNVDKSGNLWIAGFYGIDMMEMKSKTIYHVNEPVVYDNLDYLNNLLITRKGDYLYISNGKIIVVDPLRYMQHDASASIILSSFKVGSKEMMRVGIGSTQRFSYKDNFIAVEYSVLKVSPDIPAQYAYKLEGLQDNWSYTSGRGVANYTNIPPGDYVLLLNATNETGRWNAQPVAIYIVITPPFWKTWWFYLLCSVAITAAIAFIVRRRLSQLKKYQREQLRLIVATQEKEKKNISAELHDDLGVRLSALKYFVASLKKYLQPGDPVAQETYTKTMATIDESVEDVRYMLINLSPKTLNEYGYLVAVEDLVNKLSRMHIIHISLQQNGIEKRIQADVEAGLYRITQELINNTLKHAGATEVKLDIEKANGMIRLHYADNGKGFNPTRNGEGYGIENIQTRVALLNGKIDWDTAPGNPTKVTIVIPYNHT